MYSQLCNKSLKFLVPCIFAILLCLKLSEKSGQQWLTGIIVKSDGNENDDLKRTTDNKRIYEEIETFERNFFRHRDKPSKVCQMCDACRAIAYKLDTAFEIAEYQVGIKDPQVDELKEEHVKEILNKVCTRKTFSAIQPFNVNGKWRLVAPGLETAYYYQIYNQIKNYNPNLNPSSVMFSTIDYNDLEHTHAFEHHKITEMSEKQKTVNWPQRLKNHCIYMTRERLHDTEAYEFWLRTSAGQLRTFEDFLCFGEKAFGDCVQENERQEIIAENTSVFKGEGTYGDIKLRSESSDEKWPAGDQKEETDEMEEEPDDTTFDDEKNLFEKADTQYSIYDIFNYDLKYNI